MDIEWLREDPAPACPLCDDASAASSGSRWRVAATTFVPGRDRVRFAACDSCGVVFDPEFSSSELPHPERVTDYYVEQGAGFDVMVAPLLRVPQPSVRRYLEVGCGYGLCLDFAREALGWEVVGFDPSTPARAGRRELKLPISLEILPEHPAPGEAPFDLAHASEVVEHVAQPLPFLRAIHRRLRARSEDGREIDGLLSLTTPDAELVRSDVPTGTLLRVLSPGLHAVLFTAPTLASMLRRAGFEDVRIERSHGTLRAFAGPSAALARLRPSQERGDDLRSYLARRLRTAPRGSALASGLAYRLFKAEVNAGDHAAAALTRPHLRSALLERHGVDLDQPVDAATRLTSERLAGLDPLPYNLPNALYFCGIHELNGLANAGTALACFRAASTIAEALLPLERSVGIGDGESEDLHRESRRHVAIARARHEGAPALSELADLAELAPSAGGSEPARLRRTRAQVLLELVNGGRYDAARDLMGIVAQDLEVSHAAGENSDLDAPVDFALGLAHRVAGDHVAAAHRFAAAHATARATASPGSAAAAVLWEARLLEADSLHLAGRNPAAAAVARDLQRASAIPVPPTVASRAAALVEIAATANGALVELVFGIDAYWRDAHGVYLRGWAHAHQHAVRRLLLEAGQRSVATEEFGDRPDLLRFYPDHPQVRHSGFALYLPTGAAVPLTLVAETDGGVATRHLLLPDHPLPSWPPEDDSGAAGDSMPRLVREFVAAVNAFGEGAPVIEIGVRGTSRTSLDPALVERRAAYRGVRPLGVDVHPGPLVDVVGDVHELSSFVRPGSVVGVLSGSVFEHLEAPWLVAAEINRVLRIGGVSYHAAPTAWPEHAMPNDFWRFTSEGLAALFGPHTGFEVLATASSGRATITGEPAWRERNLEIATFAASTFSHILVKKTHDLDPSAVAWPGRGSRAQRARLYPVDGVVGGS